MGPEVAELARYFDVCRRKRNVMDYDLASTASETEARELVERTVEFRSQVEGWISRNHPEFCA